MLIRWQLATLIAFAVITTGGLAKEAAQPELKPVVGALMARIPVLQGMEPQYQRNANASATLESVRFSFSLEAAAYKPLGQAVDRELRPLLKSMGVEVLQQNGSLDIGVPDGERELDVDKKSVFQCTRNDTRFSVRCRMVIWSNGLLPNGKLAPLQATLTISVF